MKDCEIKKSLLETTEWIHTKENVILKSLLQQEYFDLSNVLLLHDHSSQGSGYFILMINGDVIVELEIMDDRVTEYESYSIENYIKENQKLPKLFRKRLNIAREISQFL